MPIHLVVFEKDFCFKVKMYITFFLQLSNTIIQKAISHFYVKISNIIKNMNHIFYCCSQFYDLIKLNFILNNKLILIIAFETNILYHYNFDIYSYSKSIYIYYNCQI